LVEAVSKHASEMTNHVDRRTAGLPRAALPFLGDDSVTIVGGDLAADARTTVRDASFLYAPALLQDAVDYRSLLRHWHAMLRVGGRLTIEVPHGHLERSLALPVKDAPTRKRIYTPASLLAEIEEALEPNSYRIRLLCDDDGGYDYDAKTATGHGQSIVLVLERLAVPDWIPDAGEALPGPPPAFAFEPARTRREIVALAPRQRVIILKLDHLGDFIMGIPALRKARAAFADAELTLVVGSWNVQIARDLGLFENVVGFDAFPRNSTEEKVDLAARISDFKRLMPADYDLAIDLRTDLDTRFFLQHLKAGVRAGLGTRAQFDFLDIFLPVDGSRHDSEVAWVKYFEHVQFVAAEPCKRSHFRLSYDPRNGAEFDGYFAWGPYVALQPGEYIYKPRFDIDRKADILFFDVALDMEQVTYAVGTGESSPSLQFRVWKPDTKAEFRICAAPGEPAPAFSFYGGDLYRRGASSVLHQSEYLALLIELVTMRTGHFGLLREEARPS